MNQPNAVQAVHGVNIKENKKKDKYLDFARKQKKIQKKKKATEHGSDGDTNSIWYGWNNP